MAPVSRRRKFTREEYALFHRGGTLGRKLLRVGEIMRTGELLPAVSEDTSVRETLDRISGVGVRRAGAALVVDHEGRLRGIFTDGDLRRQVQQNADFLGAPIGTVMTRDPKTVTTETLVAEAQNVMKTYLIDEVPVVDDEGRPVGMLDIQEILEVGFAI